MSLLIATLIALMPSMTSGCAAAAGHPLFGDDEILQLELELPMRTLVRKAERRPELDGELRYIDAAGRQVVLGVQVETRGHSRLEICTFPPLWLDLDKSELDGTIFAGQNRLKIVTPCRRGQRYAEYLRQEYGIYKAFGLVAEVAFRVRMLEITFRDSEGKRRDDVKAAFFIEHLDEVAARSDLEIVEQNRIEPGRLQPRHANIYAVFQFMIANTDWSILKGPGDEACCHNGKVLGEPGSDRGWYVLPYDFDQAGLINASYALPHEELGIRSVRQRLFRGRCAYMHHLDDTIESFIRQRNAIEAALASGGVSDRTKREQSNYIADFYEIVNDPGKLQRHVIDRCTGPRANGPGE